MKRSTALVHVGNPAAPIAVTTNRATFRWRLDEIGPRVWMEALEPRRLLSYSLPIGTQVAYLTPSADVPGAVDVRLEDPAGAPVATLTDPRVVIDASLARVVDQVPAALKPAGGILVRGSKPLEVDAGPNDTEISIDGWTVRATDRSGAAPVTGVDSFEPDGPGYWWSNSFGPVLTVVANDAGNTTVNDNGGSAVEIHTGAGSHDVVNVADSWQVSLRLGGSANVVTLTNTGASISLGDGDDNSVSVHGGDGFALDAGAGRRLALNIDGGTTPQVTVGGDDASIDVTATDRPNVTVNAGHCSVNVSGGSHAEVGVVGTGNDVVLRDVVFANVELSDPGATVTLDGGEASVNGYEGGRVTVEDGATATVGNGPPWVSSATRVTVERGVDAVLDLGAPADGLPTLPLDGPAMQSPPGTYRMGRLPGTIAITSGAVQTGNRTIEPAADVPPAGGAFGYYGFVNLNQIPIVDPALRTAMGTVRGLQAGLGGTIYVSVSRDSLQYMDSSTGQWVTGAAPLLLRLTAAGLPDSSFGTDGTGVVTVPVAGPILLQPDGKVLVYDSTSVTRVNPDGSLDLSYCDGGVATLPALPRPAFPGYGGADYTGKGYLGSDGSLTMSAVDGSASWWSDAEEPTPDHQLDVVAMRLTPDGRPDESFGAGGVSVTTFDLPAGSGSGTLGSPMPRMFWSAGTDVLGVAPAADGATVVYLRAWDDWANDAAALMRIVLDRQGRATSVAPVPIPALDAGNGLSVTIDTDGSVYVTGNTIVPVVVRLRPDGSVDTAFGDGGVGRSILRDGIALVPLADGRTIAVGPEFNAYSRPIALADGSVLDMVQETDGTNAFFSDIVVLRKILPDGRQPATATNADPESGFVNGNGRTITWDDGGTTGGGGTADGGTGAGADGADNATSADPTAADPWADGAAAVRGDDSIFTSTDPAARGLFADAPGSDLFNRDGDRQVFDDVGAAF